MSRVPHKLRVLVVDDSAVMRQLVSALLSASGEIEVSVAADPLIAMAKMARSRPDVILLDLEMPRMDGLTFLRRLMAEDPLPVVVCSSHVSGGSELAFRALDEGAVGIVAKPQLGLKDFLEQSATQLLNTVRAAAAARRSGVKRPHSPSPCPPDPKLLRDEVVIALGASTGGTEALQLILQSLPASVPPIVIVQHMPAGFTRAFAERLDRSSALVVREARHGDRLRAGTALIAPGDRHLRVVGGGDHFAVSVSDGPAVSGHRPSVDELFHSAARVAGKRVVAALLTGMGADGADGMVELRRRGARTIAQDEASCVIFGMPREAIQRGGADQVVSLTDMPAALLSACARVSP
jgi:two-component system, chemotaxis family, protein-glutamate methylesterase/glutaminase